MKQQVIACSIKGVLNRSFDDEKSYDKVTIPVFQRPYCWSRFDIQKILDDVDELRFIGTDDNPVYREVDYYLGTICFQIKGEKTLELLDGQQRLTSILILTNILIDLGERITECSVEKADEKLHKLKNQIKEQSEKLKYTLSSNNKKLSWKKAFNYNQPQTQNHIRIIHREFKYHYESISKDKGRYLKTLKHDIERQKFILIHGKVAVTFLTSESAAEQFFQGENNRGLSLSMLDILKAYHMRLSFPEKWNEILEIWNGFSTNNSNNEEFQHQKYLVERYVIPSLLLHAGIPPWDAFDMRNADFLKGLIGTHRKNRLVDKKIEDITKSKNDSNHPSFDLMENVQPGISFFYAINHYRKIAQAIYDINIDLNKKTRVDDRLLNCAMISWVDRFLKRDTEIKNSDKIKESLTNDLEFITYRDDFYNFIQLIRKIYHRLDYSSLRGIFGLDKVPNRNLLLLPHHTSTPAGCTRELAERTTPENIPWTLWGKRREEYKEEYEKRRKENS